MNKEENKLRNLEEELQGVSVERRTLRCLELLDSQSDKFSNDGINQVISDYENSGDLIDASLVAHYARMYEREIEILNKAGKYGLARMVARDKGVPYK